MLKQESYDSLLKKMGFKLDNNNKLYAKAYKKHDFYTIYVNFEINKIIYETRDVNHVMVSNYTTSNLDKPENIVVLECVNRLLEQGYEPMTIELEHSWPSGHGTSGRLDILVRDPDSNPYIMIECKTYGEEYKKELNNTLQTKKIGSELVPKGQLFSYYIQEKNTKFLCLYSSTLLDGEIKYENAIIPIPEEWKNLNNQKEVFDYWNKNYKVNGIFDDDIRPYNAECKALLRKDLQKLTADDSSKIFHQFLEILRHNAVSDKTNAFNKILNLFICKIVDEDRNDNDELVFQWKEETNAEAMLSALENLYKKGMSKFLGISVTDYSENDIEDKIRNLDENTKRNVINIFKKVRLHKSSEFAFKEVYNSDSFKENAIVVKEIVELLQPYQFKYGQKHQFLGNFFELLLNTSIKQEAGQFFTPVPIAKFMISSLPIESTINKKVEEDDRDLLPNMIDYASGSGHFITEYMDIVQKIINDYDTSNMSSSSRNKFERWKKKDEEDFSTGEFEWANDYVYAIEKDYRLVKTTKISTFLNGDGDANILHADGLDKFNSKDYKGKLLSTTNNNENFDFVIANPPYSVSAFKTSLNANDDDFELYKYLTENSSEIECLFVERTSQLLKRGGCASIILPSSIFTNNSKIYSETRKIILKNFYIKAVASMGSNTFMATGTSTVILFLEKRDNVDYNSIQKIVKDFFVNYSDINYEGIKNIFSTYVQENIENMEFCNYIKLFKYKNIDEFTENKYINKYIKLFESTKEWKNCKKSQEYRNYDDDTQFKIKNKKIIDFIQVNEKEKLENYLLLKPHKTIIINTGEKQEEKDFLGYYFTERSGQEGIHYYTEDGTEDGLLCSKLYSEESLNLDSTKTNYYIYKSYFNEYTEIDESLRKNVQVVPSESLINFDKSGFDSAISLKPKFSLNYNTQYKSVELDDLCEIQKGTSITVNDIVNGEIPVIAGGKTPAYYNNKSNRDGNIIAISASGANSGFVSYWEKPIFASDCTTVVSKNEEVIITKFIYILLSIKQNELYALQKGQGQPHVYPDDIGNIKIPVPPINIQKRIVELYNNNDSSLSEYIKQNIELDKELQELQDKIESKNFKKVHVGDVARVSGGKRIPKGKSFSKVKTEYPYLRVTDFRNFGVNSNTVKYVDKKVFDQISNYTISKDDIYISIAGTLGLVGMVGEKYDGQLLTENAAKISANNVNNKYLMYILSTDKIQNNIVNRGVGTPKLSLELIRDIIIPLPDEAKQKELADKFDYIYSKKYNNLTIIENEFNNMKNKIINILE